MPVEPGGESRKESIQQARRRRILLLALVFLLLSVCLITVFAPDRYDLQSLEVGEISPVTYVAEERYELVDEPAWEERKQQAVQDLRPRITVDVAKQAQIRQQFLDWLESDDELDDEGKEIARQIYAFLEQTPLMESSELLEELAPDREVTLRQVDGEISESVLTREEIRERFVRPEELSYRLERVLEELYGNHENREYIRDAVLDHISPTVEVQEESFQQRREGTIDELERPTITVSMPSGSIPSWSRICWTPWGVQGLYRG
jgi:membrane-associated HD superfamily phosphohydrolase